ncbi:hypothetical protein [Actinacidiphila oryziradicis]|uniref:Core-binding (CB) domain-containing protein n=1 Tax=Actinacidiphila oryziradicis TaxID=2571141 RepID=A0A4U0S5K2_9ACTN|nr:hypothetical protein [Actinacidiphila oryziradicis]TJZ95674.1 hypothetical protein FCI23_51920 [Actinacidiphila oryziradicis]
MTALAAELAPLPGPDTPTIAPARIVTGYTGPVSRYGDPVWTLEPLNANPSADQHRIHWVKVPPSFRPELQLVAFRLINQALPDSFLTNRHPSWRTRQSANKIYQAVLTWRAFAEWLEKRGVTSLTDCTTEDFIGYGSHLVRGRGLSRNSVQHQLIALRIMSGNAKVPSGLGR